MNFPNPSLSFSEGNKNLNTGDINTFVSHGKTLTTIITGIESSVILIYSCTSESVAMYPKGFPKATSVITSRVKYCAILAKSSLRNSDLVEMYFLSIRLIKPAI